MTDDVEETEEGEVSGPVARRKKGTGHSGWCLSSMDQDNHSRCPITIGDFLCNCECIGHGSRKGAEPRWVAESLALSLDNEDD